MSQRRNNRKGRKKGQPSKRRGAGNEERRHRPKESKAEKRDPDGNPPSGDEGGSVGSADHQRADAGNGQSGIPGTHYYECRYCKHIAERDQAEAAQPWYRRFTPTDWFNGTIAVAAVLGIVFMACSSRLANRSYNEAKIASEQAGKDMQRQLEAMELLARADVYVIKERLEAFVVGLPPAVSFELYNAGNSGTGGAVPTTVISIQAAEPSNDEVAAMRDALGGITYPIARDRTAYVDATKRDALSQSEHDDVMSGARHLYIFGNVVFDSNPRTRSCHRFCRRYDTDHERFFGCKNHNGPC